MCPDREVISLYHDGELPSPWKEKLETHLESCPACSKVLAGYKYIGKDLEELRTETVQAAQDRVWGKIAGLAAAGADIHAEDRRIQRTGGVKKIWNRSISLPLPAAAAAAVLIAALFFALLGIRPGMQPKQPDAAAVAKIGLDDQGIVPVNDMTGVLQYLSSQDNNDVMVIKLPESRHFSRSGDPALINAADYSRARRNLTP